jgi:hypothetical protein
MKFAIKNYAESQNPDLIGLVKLQKKNMFILLAFSLESDHSSSLFIQILNNPVERLIFPDLYNLLIFFSKFEPIDQLSFMVLSSCKTVKQLNQITN